MLSDMLPILSVPYFRFNPAIPRIPLDETAPPKLRELQAIGREHVTRGAGRDETTALAQLLLGHSGPPAGQRLGLLPLHRLRAWPIKLARAIGSRFAAMRGGRLRSRL